MSRLDQYLEIVPSERQKAFQDSGFHAFIHYGMNTFTDKEWGDGTDDPSKFHPSEQDTDQWCRVLKAAGARGVILTAKHHDGFCLWPTETTAYSVKNSPYKNGKGDVVREVSDSCRKYGLKFGFYLSPWDRNSEYYGTPQYNDFYLEQLKELLTGYGEIFCIWLDGACGSHLDGKEKQVYDFARYFETIRRCQPNAVISNCGPDVRWVGNEAGYARKSEWNVVPAAACDIQTIEENSQQADEDGFRQKGADVVATDLGSRKFLEDFDSFIWYPAEVDVSIRPGWFYHAKEDAKVRSLRNLLHIYYNSVGGNSLLLLNVPPSPRGLIEEADVRRLEAFGKEIRDGVAKPIAAAAWDAAPCEDGHPIENCAMEDGSYYLPAQEKDTYTITMHFGKEKRIDKVLLREQCDFSQRIEAFTVYTLKQGRKKKVYTGTTVGFRRFATLRRPVYADAVQIEITQCRRRPYLQQIAVYGAGAQLPRLPWHHKFMVAVNALGYQMEVRRQNRKNRGAGKK
ncbi:MAG: alpha-L-fucosidase [Clostridiales bacterium]|nr:alpha-L-fucosidase [Clostridiales bacterium]